MPLYFAIWIQSGLSKGIIMNFSRLSAFVVCSAILMASAGCGPIVAIPGPASEDAPTEVTAPDTYLLRPGDTVRLTVYGDEDLTDSYTVNQSGFIAIPMIGDVKADGLSTEKLRKNIATSLVKDGFMQKPLVTVDMDTVRPFYILGEVKTPGSYSWHPSLDVFKAIAIAGGYTPRAAENMILIDRGTGSSKQHLNATESTPILPGDSITIRQRIF